MENTIAKNRLNRVPMPYPYKPWRIIIIRVHLRHPCAIKIHANSRQFVLRKPDPPTFSPFSVKLPLPFGSKRICDIIRPYKQLGPNGFSARSAIFCRYWTCLFSGSLRNAASSAFEEGAPFLGTALAEYKQCIEPAVSCHFHLLDNLLDSALRSRWKYVPADAMQGTT